MNNDLKALRNLISSSIDRICGICEATGKAFPSLNDPIDSLEYTSEEIRNDPVVANCINLIVAAATQLIATVQPPSTTACVSAYRYSLTAALGVVERTNIAEILRDAGPNGLHLEEIARRGKLDSKKLGRILRYLATQHWFREVSPDVFANNLLSSTLDTGKDVTNGFDPNTKYENAKGMAAVIGFSADEFAKSGSFFVETMTDPQTAFSEEPNCAALQKALNFEEKFFEFYDRPSEGYRRNRFAAAMTCMNNVHTPSEILAGFDWAKLPHGAIVVDVGGGLGHVSLEIAKAHSKLQIVIEDRELVINQAKKFWQENLPTHVSENKVHLIAADFFDAQPKLPGQADVFILRLILHDWSDKYAIKILCHLRDAAGPTTKLVINDPVMEYACPSRHDSKVPMPLLQNMGGANTLAYSVDVMVFGAFNAGERTEEGFREILFASGWQLQEIRKSPAGSFLGTSIISKPI